MLRHSQNRWGAASIAAALFLPAAAWAGCDGPAQVREADLATIQSFVNERRVLTFAGYSGAGYESPAVMLERATDFLRSEDPSRTLVNIGATPEGIGAVYEVAKAMGFTTMGVVSSKAGEEGVAFSPCVDHVFVIRDASWGGASAETGELSPTSRAMVEVSSLMIGIGGGDVARDEMLEAKELGRPVIFIPADMNHAQARARAEARGEPVPDTFRGSAHEAMARARRGATR